MCIISAKVHAARFEKRCSSCRHRIYANDKYLRLYGIVHRGETPIEMFQCISCLIGSCQNPKVTKALEKANIKITIDNGFYKLDGDNK